MFDNFPQVTNTMYVRKAEKGKIRQINNLIKIGSWQSQYLIDKCCDKMKHNIKKDSSSAKNDNCVFGL